MATCCQNCLGIFYKEYLIAVGNPQQAEFREILVRITHYGYWTLATNPAEFFVNVQISW